MPRASRKSPADAPRAGEPNRFAFFTSLLAASAALGVGMFMGCGSDAEGDGNAASTSGNFSTGSLEPAACRGAFPNGICENFASPAETCECQDCASLAVCQQLCTDDGSCNFAPGSGEDCSCTDCHTGYQGCIGLGSNCDDPEDDEHDTSCNVGESCVCAECQEEAACQDCDNNGVCNPAFENCDCADCQGIENVCGGGPGPASTSGGGDGGSGGSPGNGGNGGTPGNGGNGGTPANGGGGNGGA